MAGARQRAEWDRSADMLAMMANVWIRRRGERAYRREHFHPFRREETRQRRRMTPEMLRGLKEVFTNWN